VSQLLFLDFDGVVCDSINECLVSSWLAHHQGRYPSIIPVDFRERFAAIRPYIRSGEDYVLIQELMSRGELPADQSEFDRHVAAAGDQRMADNRRRFYAARSELLASDRDYWLSLNTIYPHVLQVLRRLGPDERVYIMSTKESSFIVEILEYNNVEMAVERVICSGKAPKVELIASILDRLRPRTGGNDTRPPAGHASETTGHSALLIDDQIDHFLVAEDSRVEGALALWGYIKPEWLRLHPNVPTLDISGWRALAQRWLAT
jgi:phosphoglycolate phosphatase-like HAD superfamily hydrolase